MKEKIEIFFENPQRIKITLSYFFLKLFRRKSVCPKTFLSSHIVKICGVALTHVLRGCKNINILDTCLFCHTTSFLTTPHSLLIQTLLYLFKVFTYRRTTGTPQLFRHDIVLKSIQYNRTVPFKKITVP